tara:strand:+ start:2433 stop:3989 length:1557 start_codon:yes stop_codon:yes gene_type:complete
MKIIFTIFLLFISLNPKSKEQYNEMIQVAIDACQKSEHTKSLELLIEVKKYAKEQGWNKELFLALNNIGANYYLLSDYGEALQNYLDAYDIAVMHLDSQEEMVVLNNVGIIFYEENKFLEAEEYFSKAYDIASQYHDNYKMGLYAINLALVFNSTGELEKAEDYLKIAISFLQDEEEIFLKAKYAKAENLFLKRKYENAKQFLLALIPQFESDKLLEHRASSYVLLSKIFLIEKDYQTSQYYARLAKDRKNSIEIQIEISEQFYAINFNDKKYKQAIKYRDSVMILKDSLYRTKSDSRFEGNSVKFAVKNYEKELFEKNKKFNGDRKLFIAVVFFTVILLFTFFWAWQNSITKYKQKKIITERNQKIIMMKLEKELEAKNRKLVVKALSMSSSNELIKEVVESIKMEPGLVNMPQLRRQVTQLNQHIKQDSGSSDYLVHFEDANHGFLKALKVKHPILNSNDIRFISYLYMNLSIKEIASLLNITSDACRKRKERIGKKLGLEETREIYDYLFDIQQS